MFGSPILETAASLVLLYGVLSLAVTSLVELVSTRLRQRASFLEKAVRQLLSSKSGFDLSKFFLSHHLISSQAEDNQPISSYISGEQFAIVLLDILRPANLEGEFDIDRLKRVVLDLPPDSIKSVLQPLVMAEKASLESVLAGLRKWFDGAMDRVSGWYKRWCQRVALIVSLMIVLSLNADTVRIFHVVWADAIWRGHLSKMAETANNGGTMSEDSAFQVLSQFPLGWKAEDCEVMSTNDVTGIRNEMHYPFQSLPDLKQPDLWWKCFGLDLWFLFKLIASHLPGWILTVSAVSLGAPFWFDVLSKLVNLRGSGKVPVKKLDDERTPGDLTLTLKAESKT